MAASTPEHLITRHKEHNMATTTATSTFAGGEKVFHPMLSPAEAVQMAIDAIHNDTRRTPYGHHQRGRDYAVEALTRLLREHQEFVEASDG